jgi:hypothetical protein
VVTVDNTPPVISSIALSPVTSTATVTWSTNEEATSKIVYGTTSAYGSATSSALLLSAHSIGIAGLTASTLYHYAIVSTDAQGNTATSSDQTFTTTSSEPGDIVGGFTAWWSPAFAYSASYAASGGNIALLVDSATGLTTYTMTALPDGTANVAGAAASSACSGGCKIKTLYDQTGNGNNLTQATLSAMPTMKFNCIGSLPCASFVEGNSQFLATAGNISSPLSQPLTITEVSNDNTAGTNGAHIASSNSAETSVGPYFYTDYAIYAGNTNGYYTGYTQAAWHAIQSNVQQGSAAFYVDGSTPSFNNSATIGTAGISAKLEMGSNGYNNYATAYIGEAGVMSGSFTSTQNSAMNSNQHTRWGF